MAHKLESIITGLLLLFSLPTAKAPTTRYHGYELNRLAIEKAKAFTVMIGNDGFGPQWRGTGIIIGDKYILTCDHVADNSIDQGLNDLNVTFYPGYLVAKGKVVYEDWFRDLAILEIDQDATGLWTRPEFTTDNYDGEPITIIGNAEGAQKWFVGYGIVSGRNTRDLYTDGTVLPGDSGGPWINEKGQIVAISDWGLGGDTHISGGISGKEIYKFVKDWQAGSKSKVLPKVQVVGEE
jgi:S1-C subfamily serine protease